MQIYMVLYSELPLFCHVAIIHLFLLCFSISTKSLMTNNVTDRQTLLEFKSQITNDPFEVMTSWNTSLHFCHWYGITCGRRQQRVTVLDLNSLRLSGSISPHVGNLSFLRRLVLYNNSFSGEIPSQIGHLPRLQFLLLYNNSISGQIPPTISNCSNLLFIDLSGNNLAGEIPVGLGSLLKLETIILSKNKLIGTLPPPLGNISSLKELYVAQNELQGVIPDSLGQLMNLRNLSLSLNKFSGVIPPSIFNLSFIEIMDVGSNNLRGNLPLGLGISLPNLQLFSVASNQFTGTIPTSISNASNLQVLQLSKNNFTGIVPSLENLRKLSRFVVYTNHFGSGKTDDLNFLSTLINATRLTRIDIGNNNFRGKLPQQISNLSKNFEKFVIQYNQIYGSIPSGLCDFGNLNVFFASSNKLSGEIPPSIGNLQNLRILDLHSNKISGFIPTSVGNLTNLIELLLSNNHLQGIIPSKLWNCKKLLLLDLAQNNLSGPIPPQIFGLSSLSIYFNLSRNRLSGSLPIEVGNLKNLGVLSLYENMLSGEIPSSLGSCTSLEVLYIDANLFNGSIPSSLRSLRGIQELNLSHNNFTGKIPEFFYDFKSIKFLDLSYNDFQGMVPAQGIFKNASVVSVAGNKNLCGVLPDFNLPACKNEQDKRGLTVKLKIIISLVFLIIISVSVIIYLFICHSRKRRGESALIWDGDSLLNLSYQSLHKATNGFSSNNLIGTGSFGSIYKGILKQKGTVIAVKVFNLMRPGASKSFIAECEALRNIRHRNIVKVLTACSSIDFGGKDFKALVYEFMGNGSLNDWLHPIFGVDEVPRPLNVVQRLNIAIDIASAVDYLHHHSATPIIHCDLKPSNVLLNEEMTTHLSDFGITKFLSDQIVESSASYQSSSIGIRGTVGYCPPEYGIGSEVSTMGDIFSFGITLLEIFTAKRPTDEMFNDCLSLHVFVKRALPESVMEIIDPNLLLLLNEDATSNFRSRRNDIVKECLISIFEIGISCSAEPPQERMSIGDVVARLSSIRKELHDAQLPREQEVASALQLAGTQG